MNAEVKPADVLSHKISVINGSFTRGLISDDASLRRLK